MGFSIPACPATDGTCAKTDDWIQGMISVKLRGGSN
jgi:hypothetical protein